MIALHARRSAASVHRFREAYPDRPIALVLTGTDIYGDLASDEQALRSLDCATHLVVLQAEALHRLAPTDRTKARVILQSAPELLAMNKHHRAGEFVAVGHLRDVKDPRTFMKAARELQDSPDIQLVHIGEALEQELATEALRTMGSCPNYRWLGGLTQRDTRIRIAGAHALVHMSRLEGGANVVIEAVCSKVPVIASRIDGNIGLLGCDYDGYFSVGDSAELADLMRRVRGDSAFHEHLRSQCAWRAPLFAPAAEMSAIRALLDDMLGKVPTRP